MPLLVPTNGVLWVKRVRLVYRGCEKNTMTIHDLYQSVGPRGLRDWATDPAPQPGLSPIESTGSMVRSHQLRMLSTGLFHRIASIYIVHWYIHLSIYIYVCDIFYLYIYMIYIYSPSIFKQNHPSISIAHFHPFPHTASTIPLQIPRSKWSSANFKASSGFLPSLPTASRRVKIFWPSLFETSTRPGKLTVRHGIDGP
jgi:hypothetical protein